MSGKRDFLRTDKASRDAIYLAQRGIAEEISDRIPNWSRHRKTRAWFELELIVAMRLWEDRRQLYVAPEEYPDPNDRFAQRMKRKLE